MAINALKQVEIHLFVFEDVVVVKLVARLLCIELALEYTNLFVKSLQFVCECTLVCVSGRIVLISFV